MDLKEEDLWSDCMQEETVDERDCVLNDKDLGASGYGENPFTGEIIGGERQGKSKKRAKAGTFLHPIKDEVHSQICKWLNPADQTPLPRYYSPQFYL